MGDCRADPIEKAGSPTQSQDTRTVMSQKKQKGPRAKFVLGLVIKALLNLQHVWRTPWMPQKPGKPKVKAASSSLYFSTSLLSFPHSLPWVPVVMAWYSPTPSPSLCFSPGLCPYFWLHWLLELHFRRWEDTRREEGSRMRSTLQAPGQPGTSWDEAQTGAAALRVLRWCCRRIDYSAPISF